MEDWAGNWAVYSTGVLAALAFLTSVSEKLQALLGPLGRWLGDRNRRAIERQSLIEQRYEGQVDVLLAEVDFYKERYNAVVVDLRAGQAANLRLIRERNELRRRITELEGDSDEGTAD